MSNILLTRIDDRLIHGQVVSQWCTELKPDWMLVGNQKSAGHESGISGRFKVENRKGN